MSDSMSASLVFPLAPSRSLSLLGGYQDKLTDDGDRKGEKVTIKAHGGTIDIQGVTVAKVDEAVRLQSVDTWFDPMEMFRQIAGNGSEVVREAVSAEQKEAAADQESAEKEGVVVTEKEVEKNLDGSESLVVAPGEIGEEKPEEVATDGTSGCPFFNKE